MADQIFSCWATLPTGEHRRLEVCATGHDAAIRACFAMQPRATSMSCQPLHRLLVEEVCNG